MSWFSNLFSAGASTLVDSVGNAVDKLVTSDEEKLILKNEIEKEVMKFKIEMETKSNEFESEITKRWVSDNDSFITKLVRPLSYTFILVVFASVMFADGNIGEFKVNPAYIPVVETLLVTMTIAYFGGRSSEKITKLFKDK